MSKKRRSVSLSLDNDEFLSNHDNASALVDRLITEYRRGGSADSAMKRLRVKQVSAEIASMKSNLEHKQDELESLRADIKSESEIKQQKLTDAREQLQGVPRNTDNPAIKNWASKLSMTPEEFIDEL